MSQLYNYQRFQQLADMESRKVERVVYWLCLSVLVILFGGYAFWRFKRAQTAAHARLSENLNDAITTLSLLQNGDDNSKDRINSSGDKSHKLDELINVLNNTIAYHKEEFDKLRRVQKETAFMNSSIVDKFCQKKKWHSGYCVPTEKDWETLIHLFAQNMPLAYTIIYVNNTLTETEQRICLLSLLGFQSSEMSYVLGMSNQGISNLKSSSNAKLFGESTAKTLKKNLVSHLNKTR